MFNFVEFLRWIVLFGLWFCINYYIFIVLDLITFLYSYYFYFTFYFDNFFPLKLLKLYGETKIIEEKSKTECLVCTNNIQNIFIEKKLINWILPYWNYFEDFENLKEIKRLKELKLYLKIKKNITELKFIKYWNYIETEISVNDSILRKYITINDIIFLKDYFLKGLSRKDIISYLYIKNIFREKYSLNWDENIMKELLDCYFDLHKQYNIRLDFLKDVWLNYYLFFKSDIVDSWFVETFTLKQILLHYNYFQFKASELNIHFISYLLYKQMEFMVQDFDFYGKKVNNVFELIQTIDKIWCEEPYKNYIDFEEYLIVKSLFDNDKKNLAFFLRISEKDVNNFSIFFFTIWEHYKTLKDFITFKQYLDILYIITTEWHFKEIPYEILEYLLKIDVIKRPNFAQFSAQDFVDLARFFYFNPIFLKYIEIIDIRLVELVTEEYLAQMGLKDFVSEDYIRSNKLVIECVKDINLWLSILKKYSMLKEYSGAVVFKEEYLGAVVFEEEYKTIPNLNKLDIPNLKKLDIPNMNKLDIIFEIEKMKSKTKNT